VKAAHLAGLDREDEVAVAKALNAIGGEWEGQLAGGECKYRAQLQAVADLRSTAVVVDVQDLLDYPAEWGRELAEHVLGNTWRYIQLFSEAVDALLPARSADAAGGMESMDVVDVITSHRRARLEGGDAAAVPPALLRRYSVLFRAPRETRRMAVRDVKAEHVGTLVTLRGIITRVSEVKPLLVVGTYSCEACGYEVYQEVTAQAFQPLPECASEECRRSNRKGELFLQSRGSRFQKFQEARLQELTDQVPMGHIPRSMAVHLLGDMARRVHPGDAVLVSGVFMPRPYTGFKAVRAGLLTDTYLLASDVQQVKPKYELMQQLAVGAELGAELVALSADPDAYGRLAASIAPEIYGHADVKRALLLLMVGGLTRELPDGMRIRGDINVCLMGDPGVAKSQLLKYIAKVAPRAVYTTGRGSSGVGLTAAVTKDALTGEMVLEGGALVLADNGICAIDEFDKMDEHDRTAIHEVMEQQTISIAKAGITTTLNARASILAAANPLHGRYNPKRSPRENINLPPALLSRFDILFLVLDRASLEADTRLAEHVCQVHRTGEAPQVRSAVPPETLRQYIAIARQFQPRVPQALVDYIVGAYVSLRMNDAALKETTYTTPRTLLAVLRLSQALAKLRLSNLVAQADVDEAMRLMEVSRASVDCHLERSARARVEGDPLTRIYALIRDLAARSPAAADGAPKELPMDAIRELVRARNFSEEQLQACLAEFDQCNIWALSPGGASLKIYN
jgi:DNA replication licensing factor MCM7